jgi:SRSO17 transposase
MTPAQMRALDRELSSYFESMVTGMGRAERRRAMELYLTGLLLDGERKSIEPMAGRLVDDARHTEAMRQRLQECVSVSDWSDAEMRRRLALKLDDELPGVEALVVDDTGYPKKGKHSVGVARQYSGTLGRTDNCQVAVSLHLAGEQGSGCIGLRLFLPEEWTADRERCRRVGVPDDVAHARKWELALSLVDDSLRWGVGKHVVLADAGYGDASEFRDGLRARGLPYLVRVQGTHRVWPPGAKPKPPESSPGRSGRPRTRFSAEGVQPWSIEALAPQVPEEEFHRVSWREGSRGVQSSTFAAVRVHSAERHTKGKPPSLEQWLLLEWPTTETQPTKYYLSSLPAGTPLKSLVRLAKLRWRVERDYQELEQELGLDHFEGRTWRGFHHHATLCAVAHGFLALRRALFPPEPSAVDATHGPTPASASAPALGRLLPALPSAAQLGRTASRTVAHVIRSY